MSNHYILQFMAFPLNVIFAVAWLATLFFLYREKSGSSTMKFLLSMRATIISIVATVVGAIGIAFIPNFSTSIIFIAILLFVQSHLALVIFRGCRGVRGIRWRFLMNHAGLWLALFAGFWGASDTQDIRVQAFRDAPTREAFHKDGGSTFLDYNVRLLGFDVDYFDNGTPSHYEASVALGSDTATLRVNHPYALNFFEDVYLISYDTSRGSDTQYCIIQIVREPWKAVLFAGILMMLAGAVLLFIQGAKRR